MSAAQIASEKFTSSTRKHGGLSGLSAVSGDDIVSFVTGRTSSGIISVTILFGSSTKITSSTWSKSSKNA